MTFRRSQSIDFHDTHNMAFEYLGVSMYCIQIMFFIMKKMQIMEDTIIHRFRHTLIYILYVIAGMVVTIVL